jgi:hypothetical protein
MDHKRIINYKFQDTLPDGKRIYNKISEYVKRYRDTCNICLGPIEYGNGIAVMEWFICEQCANKIRYHVGDLQIEADCELHPYDDQDKLI